MVDCKESESERERERGGEREKLELEFVLWCRGIVQFLSLLFSTPTCGRGKRGHAAVTSFFYRRNMRNRMYVDKRIHLTAGNRK